MKVVVPLTVAAIGLGIAANVAAGGGFGVVVWNVHRLADWFYLRLGGGPKVTLSEPPLFARGGTLVQLRPRPVQHPPLVPPRPPHQAGVPRSFTVPRVR